jgi:hypothetical protein
MWARYKVHNRSKTQNYRIDKKQIPKILIMEYLYIKRAGDKETIADNVNWFEARSNESLIEDYNKQSKCGITGVHEQALFLMAMGHVFFKRFGKSPIYMENNFLGMKEQIKLVGDTFEYVDKPTDKPLVPKSSNYVDKTTDKPLVAKSSEIFPMSDFHESPQLKDEKTNNYYVKKGLAGEKVKKLSENFEGYFFLIILYTVASFSVSLGLRYVNFSLDLWRIFLSLIGLIGFYCIGQFGTYISFTRTHRFSTLLVCLCIAIGIFNMPYSYYINLRCFVFMIGVSAIIGLAVLMRFKKKRRDKLKTIILILLLSIVIILFNPFFKFIFSKENWIIIDILTVFVFASLLFYKEFIFPET